MKKSSLYLMLFVTMVPQSSFASFRFLYGEEPRVLEINSFEKTLLVFPEPPLAKVCHPSNVVSLETLDDIKQVKELVPSSTGYDFIDRLQTAKKVESSFQAKEAENSGRSSLLAKHVKLTPLRQSGGTTCAFKLVNGETVMVSFLLSSTIQRPVVEFQSISTVSAPAKIAENLGGINIFRDLLSGGELAYLIDITPKHTSRHWTEKATYTLAYLGTDNKSYKAWKIKGRAKIAFEAPMFLDSNISGLMFSAYKSQNAKEPRKIEKEGYFEIYVMTTNDYSTPEMWSKLP